MVGKCHLLWGARLVFLCQPVFVNKPNIFKNTKKQISMSVWSVQHPNAGENIQQPRQKNAVLYQSFPCSELTLSFCALALFQIHLSDSSLYMILHYFWYFHMGGGGQIQKFERRKTRPENYVLIEIWIYVDKGLRSPIKLPLLRSLFNICNKPISYLN